jgi:hypothetical protein
MTGDTPSLDSPEHTELFTQLGRLVIAWNELEHTIRGVIFMLTLRDPVTAIILTADMNASALMQALRTVALEYDSTQEAMHRDKQANEFFSKALPERALQQVSPHVSHFLEYCDRLRDFRNFYVHGIRVPDPKVGPVARSMSARKRLSFYSASISVSDIEKLTARIMDCAAYGNAVETAIGQADLYRWQKDALPPSWPEKPPLPDVLSKPRQGLRGD